MHSIASPPCFWFGQYVYLMMLPCFTSSSTRAVQSPSLAVLKKYTGMFTGRGLEQDIDIAAAKIVSYSSSSIISTDTIWGTLRSWPAL